MVKQILSVFLCIILFISCTDKKKEKNDFLKVNFKKDNVYYDYITNRELLNQNLNFKKDTLVWYNIYDSKSKKLKELIQYYFTLNEKPQMNQYKVFNSEGDIIRGDSYFIDLNLKDTLVKGVTDFSIDFIGNVDKNRVLIGACVENSYPNKIKVDSFLGNKKTNRIELSFLNNSLGTTNVRGFVIQEHRKKIKINDTLGKLDVYYKIIYFNKPVFIK